MNILGYKSGGHDGSICYVQDDSLVYSIEAEKDSNPRHDLFTVEQVESIVSQWDSQPDIICGDSKKFGGLKSDNYMGTRLDSILYSRAAFLGREFEYASVPHELAHIASSYALSDIPNNEAFYALVWEGYIGRFYHVDEKFNVTVLGDTPHVMDHVGLRYSVPYHAVGRADMFGHSSAGKIMALAGLAVDLYMEDSKLIEIADMVLDSKLTSGSGRIALDGNWTKLYDGFSLLKGKPVDTAEFVTLCKLLQDKIFERFSMFAKTHITQKLPLVISGGCGLNCNWNTLWRNSGLFTDVFVPPVTNDTGIAIGSAAVIKYLHTGSMKMKWDVYCGEEFIEDDTDIEAHGFVKHSLDVDELSERLVRDEWVVAWVQGRYEMGPRALCHRSLIAAPFIPRMTAQLNKIKRREYFRPVAPVCMEEDVSIYFDWVGPSPYMLYFQNVNSADLGAVTHIDGTARVQTINRNQDAATYDLLAAFKRKTGYGVLCNTSLNFLGCGFINRTSDLVRYVCDNEINAMIINNFIYIKKGSS